MLKLVTSLIERCYDVIDSNADKVILSEEFSNLNRDLMVSILQRDTLNVTSEMKVYEAISQWACQKCKKDRKELTDQNKRKTLNENVFLPRYLTMSLEEFNKVPLNSAFLTNEERNILAKILQSEQVELPEYMDGFKMNIPRNNLINEKALVGKRVLKEQNEKGMKIVNRNITNQVKKTKTKSSTTRKIMKGIGDIMIMIIQVLD